jgi:arylsulfatase A-like enzyme
VKRCREWIEQSTDDSKSALLWIKSRGVPVPWVPPQQFAELYLEEFGLAIRDEDDQVVEAGFDEGRADNDPQENAGASRKKQDDETESDSSAPLDESLAWRYAGAMYATYVTLLDRWLGKLLETIDESPGWNGALLIIAAGTGQALGEHGALADERPALRAECLQTPLWLRVPDSDQAEWFCSPAQASRPIDVSAGLAGGRSLLSLVRNEVSSLRDMVLMGNGRSEWGIGMGNSHQRFLLR